LKPKLSVLGGDEITKQDSKKKNKSNSNIWAKTLKLHFFTKQL